MRWPQEAASGPQLTAGKNIGTQSYSCKEQNHANSPASKEADPCRASGWEGSPQC